MFPELALDLLQFLPEPVDFPKGRLVVVGRVGEEGAHLVAVEAAQGRREVGLAEIEGRDFHGPGLLHGSTGTEKHIPYHSRDISISPDKL